MRNVTSAFKQMLYNNQRNYNVTLDITLSDGTELTVTNENIMDGGIEIEDAVGDDGSFSVLGSTIINGCNVTLYNNTENYSDYVFINAKVIVKINLVGADSSDEIQFGVFTVDEPTYGESTVTLNLLDNMCQFDRPYTAQSRNIYTASTTLRDIVYDACSKCGVLYDSSMTNFPNYTFIVPEAPKDDCTYREVIGWCATLAGCYATMTSEGKLKFDWFNIDAFTNDTGTDGGVFDSASPYATGDNVNGGTFNPWNDPSNVDGGEFTTRRNIQYITNLSTQNIGVDDVVITGIRVTYDVESDGSNTTETQLRGTDDYVIDIKENPFITADNYIAVLDYLEPILIGLQFRPFNITQPNDPTIEAGDVAYLWDTKGNQYRTFITRVTFSPTALQTVVCGAESPEKNSSTRLSTVTKAIVKSQRQLNEEKSIREQLEEDFQQAIANGNGLYTTTITTGGSEISYAHDKPALINSKKVLKFSDGGIGVTDNYTGDDSTTVWYGFDFSGTWLANIISTMNLFFDYAHGGTLKLGGAGNGNGLLVVYDENDNPIGQFDSTGISAQGDLRITNKISSTDRIIVFGGNYAFREYLTTEGYSRYYSATGFAVERKRNQSTQVGVFGIDQYLGVNWRFPRISSYIAQHVYGNLASIVLRDAGYDYVLNIGLGTLNLNLNYYKWNKPDDEFNSTPSMVDTQSLTLRINNQALAFVSSSSRRYKHNIKSLSAERDAHKLLELPVVEFEWNDDHVLQYKDMRGQVVPGIIAEDVEEIYPSAVIHNEDGEVESWDERRIIPGMLALIQEQQKKLDEQEERIAKLEELVAKLVATHNN